MNNSIYSITSIILMVVIFYLSERQVQHETDKDFETINKPNSRTHIIQVLRSWGCRPNITAYGIQVDFKGRNFLIQANDESYKITIYGIGWASLYLDKNVERLKELIRQLKDNIPSIMYTIDNNILTIQYGYNFDYYVEDMKYEEVLEYYLSLFFSAHEILSDNFENIARQNYDVKKFMQEALNNKSLRLSNFLS